MGARFKRPLVMGLVFVFGWEQAALVIPGYMRRFTVAYYLQSLVPHAMPSDGLLGLLQSLFRDDPSLPVAPGVRSPSSRRCSCAWRSASSERREYVLEQ